MDEPVKFERLASMVASVKAHLKNSPDTKVCQVDPGATDITVSVRKARDDGVIVTTDYTVEFE